MQAAWFVRPFLLFAFIILSLLAACGDGDDAETTAPPPPEVAAIELHPAPVHLTLNYAGRVRAASEVEVRAQVGGILLSRDYTEGARVKAGDILYRIDPAPYAAAVAQARAQLQQQRAQQQKARTDANRARTLFEQNVGTAKARDDAISALAVADGAVAVAQAQLETTELNLGYTKVTAPITGITSLEVLPQGSLVGVNSLLTRITQTDPIQVVFSFTDTDAAEIRTLLESNAAFITGQDGRLGVRLRFGDGRIHPAEGFIDFTSSMIDPKTGTIQARAFVPNTDGVLLPGQFVQVTVVGVTLKAGIVVPEPAVMQGPQGTFVYVIGQAGKAAARPVRLGRQTPQGWLVNEGLQAGDKIVTEGVIKVRPGSPVKVVNPQAAPKVTP